MVSLVIVSPLPKTNSVSKTAKNRYTLEWSVYVFEHSYYTTNIRHFFINLVNIEKFPSLQASKG
ncbi:hypothetical protein JP0118_10360 [Helicobacter pylori]|nr:hypothetical protein JP0118_10360 [Helicobacter pylori]